ncbi:MAG: prepilin peptidase [Lachnospiraceae bacterium]|nr:prepilin peptidase [Lachnospiraceae bacterium]
MVLQVLNGFFILLLILIGRIDYKYRKIPNGLIILLWGIGILAGIVSREPDWILRLAGMFAVSLPLFLIVLAFPGSIGGGDIKLMAAGGMFLGMKLIFLSFILALAGCGMWCAAGLASGRLRRKEKFALGPFLCAGMAACVFWGEKLWKWFAALL